MEIGCSTDAKFIMPLGVMLTSLILNNPDEELNIHVIIDETVSTEDKEALKQTVEAKDGNRHVFFYLFKDELMSDFPQIGEVSKWISKATYYRLCITDIFPKTINKLLYLDADIIVRHSLKALWNTDIADVAVAGVMDQCEKNIGVYNRLQYDSDLGSFNAGVLLMNLRLWRENNLRERFLNFIKEYPERIKFHDQDVLNYVLCHSKIALPLKYNVQAMFYAKIKNMQIDYWKNREELEQAIADPFILHFSTHDKPWLEGCHHPLRQEWLRYKQLSNWNNFPLWHRPKQKKTLRNHIGDALRALHLRKSLPVPESIYREDIHLVR